MYPEITPYKKREPNRVYLDVLLRPVKKGAGFRAAICNGKRLSVAPNANPVASIMAVAEAAFSEYWDRDMEPGEVRVESESSWEYVASTSNL